MDNQKAAVLAHPSNGQVRFNERFLDLAGHYDFTPRACRPYRARVVPCRGAGVRGVEGKEVPLWKNLASEALENLS